MPRSRVLRALLGAAVAGAVAAAQACRAYAVVGNRISVLPLYSFYSAADSDNYVTATAAGIADATAQGYGAYGDGDGAVYSNSTAPPSGNTTALATLEQWYSSSAQDHLLVASAEGKAFAKAHGYALVRTEGWVLDPSAPPSTLAGYPLKQYYHSGRNDHFLTGSAAEEQLAVSAGYVLQRVEGYPGESWQVWPNAPPADIPFPRSQVLGDVHFSGVYGAYGGADTWYPSWAADGTLYSGFTDGVVSGIKSRSGGANGTTGHVHIVGDDPLNLTLANVSVFTADAMPFYPGRYPSANLHHNGVWYQGSYGLANLSPDGCGNWCTMGPFIDFRVSTDDGATWDEPRVHVKGWADNLFGESAQNNSKVKFGAPHVVDFGRNMEHSPDGYMYMVATGAQRPDAPLSWMQGDQVYMCRVTPSPQTINDGSQYEFFAGNTVSDADGTVTPTWVQGDVSKAQPLFTWLNRTGVVTMTYAPALSKYLTVVSTPTFSPSMVKQFDTYFLESDSMTGPFSYISYLSEFGPEAYFVHWPSKFMSASTTQLPPTPDGREAAGAFDLYLSYSANFAFHSGSDPVGSGYHWTLEHTRITLKNTP